VLFWHCPNTFPLRLLLKHIGVTVFQLWGAGGEGHALAGSGHHLLPIQTERNLDCHCSQQI
jgi:hypothetical protein